MLVTSVIKYNHLHRFSTNCACINLCYLVTVRLMKPPIERKNLKVLGKRIAELRKQQGFTQEQLAEKAGMAAHSLAYIEQGQRFPRYLTTFQKIAKSINVPLYELFKGL